MPKLTINQSGDQQWDRIAQVLNGEQGDVVGEFVVDGAKLYAANFPVYGCEFTWIPDSACTITES